MSAIETIETAIAKLEALAVAAGYQEFNGWLTESNETDDYGHYEAVPVTNDPLMVLLHRTIDAQLAFLRHQERHGRIASFNLVVIPHNDTAFWDAVDLSRAILGGAA